MRESEAMLAQFTEGFDTRDLAEAKALLTANAQPVV